MRAVRHNHKTPSRGFTIVELLVVVSIVSMLMALLLPSMKNARERARAVRCAANLRSLGVALAQYAGDNSRFRPINKTTPTGWACRDWYRIYKGYILADNALGKVYSTSFPYFDNERNMWLLATKSPLFNCPTVYGLKPASFFGPVKDGLPAYGIGWPGNGKTSVFNYNFNNLNGSFGIDVTKTSKIERVRGDQMMIMDRDPVCNFPTANQSVANAGTGKDDCNPAGMAGAYWNNFFTASAPATGTNTAGTHHADGANMLFSGMNVKWVPAKYYYTGYPSSYTTFKDIPNF